MSEAQLYWAWDRKQPYNQDGSKRYVEMVDVSDYDRLRDEVVRLRAGLLVAKAFLLQTKWRDDVEAMREIEAALTPQGGDKDAELQAYKQWESDMFCDEKAGWEHSKMNPRNHS